MREHFVQAISIGGHIIDGDLEAAKKNADWIARHPRPKQLPEPFDPHISEMKEAAKKLSTAEDLEAASMANAEIGASCGSCHRAVKADIPFAEMQDPPTEGDIKAHMKRHAWGVTRLWEGLVGPSEERWKSGAVILAEHPLKEEAFLEQKVLSTETATNASKVHELGQEAVEAKTPQERTAIFGRLLGTCARCHTELGVKPSKIAPPLPQAEP